MNPSDRPADPFRPGDRVLVDSALTKRGRIGGDRGVVESIAWSLGMQRFDVVVRLDNTLRHRLTFASHRVQLLDGDAT